MSKKATLKYSVFVITIILSLFFCITNVLATETPAPSQGANGAQTIGDLLGGTQRPSTGENCQEMGSTTDYVPPQIGEIYTNTNGTLGLDLEFSTDEITEME